MEHEVRLSVARNISEDLPKAKVGADGISGNNRNVQLRFHPRMFTEIILGGESRRQR